MTLSERLSEYVRACFTGIWIQSFEHDDAVVEIARLCRQQGWSLATWDIDRGLSIAGQRRGHGHGDQRARSAGGDQGARLARHAGRHGDAGAAKLPPVPGQRGDRAGAGHGHRGRQAEPHRSWSILAPVVQIPVELERQFVVIEHDLPGRDQLRQIARAIATEPGELPEGDGLDAVLDAAAGLTRFEAENAFSLSLMRHGRVCSGRDVGAQGPDAQEERPADAAPRRRVVRRPGRPGGAQGVLQSLPDAQAGQPAGASPGRAPARRPGTGKSAFCKALGNEVGRPTLILDIGALMGSLVGMTEERTRQALRIADAMAPCIVFVDEIEKGLSGVQASGQTDSGVSARMFGTLLSWLNDHESDVYFVCTANDVSKLPPEFTRAERFDAIFFLDLPGVREKEQIWRLYLEKFGLDPDQKRPSDREFTGAEIRACCRLAALLDVPLVEAAANIVPVAITAGESVERLRNWASRPVPVRRPAGHLFARGRLDGAVRSQGPPWRCFAQLSDQGPGAVFE